jgi:hypothetical protein
MALYESVLEGMSAKAALALPYIEAGVSRGLGSAEIIETLKSAGEFGESMTFRRTDMLSLIRSVSGVQSTGTYLRSVRDTYMPDPRRLVSPITSTLRKFSFRVAVKGTDTLTGEDKTLHVTVSTNNLMTAGQLKQDALALAESGALGGGKAERYQSFTAASAAVLSGTMMPGL